MIDTEQLQFDLIVIGATPGGIACAVRAAREGLRVLLTNHNAHIGGMLSNGILQWDTLYGGHRAPFFSELLGRIDAHYKAAFGEDSEEYQCARFSQEHYPVGLVEPRVAERIFNEFIAAEPNITLMLNAVPVQVERDGALLQSVTLRQSDGAEFTMRAVIFADCTYEGDLMALSGVEYRVGREGRDEYHEPHAGKLFTQIERASAPRDAIEGRLNLRVYDQRQGASDPNSTAEADGAIQAYNLRPIVTCNPATRILPNKPKSYNREEYLNYHRRFIPTNTVMGCISMMNSPILPGENHAYPEGDEPTRRSIFERHRDFALGLIYFLQNDESVPPKQRAEFQKWGLSSEEFADNNHLPYEMYVREARRLVGRYVHTEHDNMIAPRRGRPLIHGDSIAFTEWYMDSHACTTESRPDFPYDGKLIPVEESRPAQVPYRCLLPKDVDNLLVPVCLSATHVAWGAIRLEPVWVQIGEVAGFAAALSAKNNVPPAQLDSNLLLRTLCEAHFIVSFFNDMGAVDKAEWIPSIQYLSTKGFFPDYDARPHAVLDAQTRKRWTQLFTQLAGGISPDPLQDAPEELTRGEACRLMYHALPQALPHEFLV